jgi:Zn-dependent protease with chaperone function
MIALAGAVAAALLTFAAPAPAAVRPPAAHTILEHRVDAIPDAQLEAADPVRLIETRRQIRAERYRFERRILLLAGLLVPALILYRLWRSGGAARIRAWISRGVPPRLRTVVYTLVIIAIGWLAAFPFSFIDYRINRLYGLTRQPPAEWFGSWLVQATIATVLLALVAAGLLWLADRTRLWYVFASIGIVVATVALAFFDPVAIEPLMTSSRPLEHGDLPAFTRAGLLANHVPAVPIYVGEVPRTGLVAGVAGIGPTQRIVVADYVIASASAREKLFVLMREFGRISTADTFRSALIFAGFAVLTLAIAIAIADRVPFRTDDDPLARLALVGACALLASIVVWLPVAYYLRQRDAAADRYALRATRDPRAAIRSIVRSTDELLIPYCPGVDWVFPDVHEPPGTRIAAIRDQPDPCR